MQDQGLSCLTMNGNASSPAATKLWACSCRYSKLFTLHCTAHSLDLFIEKVGALPEFKKYIQGSKRLIRIVTNHDATRAAFNELSKLRLLKPGDTLLGSLSVLVVACRFAPGH